MRQSTDGDFPSSPRALEEGCKRCVESGLEENSPSEKNTGKKRGGKKGEI